MTLVWTFIAYLVAAALFITGIRRLRTPETARSGNTLAALGMIIALVATLFVPEFGPPPLNAVGIGIGVLFGAILGAFSAQRVPMTAMPQMVATFNGLGGGATVPHAFRLHRRPPRLLAHPGLFVRDTHRRGGHARRHLALERLHGLGSGGVGVRAQQLRPPHRRHAGGCLGDDPHAAHEPFLGASSQQH